MAKNRFAAAAPKASRLYRTGRYKSYAAAMKAALKTTTGKKHRRKVGATKFIERGETRSTPATRVIRRVRTRTGHFKRTETVSGLMSRAKSMINERIDKKVLQKYHATTKRDKKKIQKGIAELKAALRRLR